MLATEMRPGLFEDTKLEHKVRSPAGHSHHAALAGT